MPAWLASASCRARSFREDPCASALRRQRGTLRLFQGLVPIEKADAASERLADLLSARPSASDAAPPRGLGVADLKAPRTRRPPAWGELTGVRNKGMWGKSGKLDAQMLFMRLNGRQIRLTGAFEDKGVTGTGAVVGAVLLLPIAGFFMTGTSALLPKGGTVGGFIDEDVPLAFSAVTAAPMQVPVAAPAAEVAAPGAVAAKP